MPPSIGPARTGSVLTESVPTTPAHTAARGGPGGAAAGGRARRGVVLTRRGRLTVATLAMLTVLAVAIAVQSLTGGTTTEEPLARAAAGGTVGSAAGQGAPLALEDPLTTPTTDSRLRNLLPSADPAQSPRSGGDAPAQVVVNGRTQPPLVEVPTAASGELVGVPGSTEPVTGEHVWTYRVEVERGLPFDATEFAAAVHATLSDPRGWAQDGNVFQRVDGGDVDFRLLLASPDLTDQLCAPLQTLGRVSCRNGDLVVLNALRWGDGIDDYKGDVASYREYMVNHEVGHRLGRSHTLCQGASEPAPVMMQQTYGLEGCAANSWPLPGE